MCTSLCKSFNSLCFHKLLCKPFFVFFSYLFYLLYILRRNADGTETQTNSFVKCMWHLMDTLNDYRDRPELFDFSETLSMSKCLFSILVVVQKASLLIILLI